ncbi:hypothetical protein PMAYCL1PPCAC_32612 [Pristionchus mayeri]|uniref:Decapping nuclease n=1 Tax=Pristionchus mayeri TaxID=1317129 RepID=A0AAN5DH41_9BILA|nr:hypothetical protein PMAYCL1PPCAC_32612 [Pristionchus mayeri]
MEHRDSRNISKNASYQSTGGRSAQEGSTSSQEGSTQRPRPINAEPTDEEGLLWYSGYKFEQYMTCANAEETLDPNRKIRFKIFENVITADLEEEGFNSIRLCSFAEIDALRKDEPIEIKLTGNESFTSKIHTYLHCAFANKKTIITGLRNENYVVTKVIERRTSDLVADLRSSSEGDSRADEKCFSFLYDVLAMTKHVLTRAKACRFIYMPRTGIIQFEPITILEVEKRGYRFPEEFQTKFQPD